jgi:hypothetical protein
MAEKYTTEKKYYLIDTSVDWADEMDVHAFTILEKDEYKKLLKYVKAQDNDWCLGIFLGTNEDTTLDKDEVLDMLKDAERITGEQADFLMEKVGQCEHNIFEDIMQSDEKSEGEE